MKYSKRLSKGVWAPNNVRLSVHCPTFVVLTEKENFQLQNGWADWDKKHLMKIGLETETRFTNSQKFALRDRLGIATNPATTDHQLLSALLFSSKLLSISLRPAILMKRMQPEWQSGFANFKLGVVQLRNLPNRITVDVLLVNWEVVRQHNPKRRARFDVPIYCFARDKIRSVWYKAVLAAAICRSWTDEISSTGHQIGSRVLTVVICLADSGSVCQAV